MVICSYVPHTPGRCNKRVRGEEVDCIIRRRRRRRRRRPSCYWLLHLFQRRQRRL